MYVLQIEHSVPSYERWKESFDEDPIGRQGSGVKRYRIYRPSTDSKYVIIDLEFDDILKAESVLMALHTIWAGVQGQIMVDPRTRIVEVVESKELLTGGLSVGCTARCCRGDAPSATNGVFRAITRVPHPATGCVRPAPRHNLRTL